MSTENTEIQNVYQEFLVGLSELKQKQDDLIDEFTKLVEQERITELKARLNSP
jgi:vacuolar-type H+-ATPase subunit D/Vma8